MRKTAFQANRKEEVLHCRQSCPLLPPGKLAVLRGRTLKKGETQSIDKKTEIRFR